MSSKSMIIFLSTEKNIEESMNLYFKDSLSPYVCMKFLRKRKLKL